jgi:ribose 5-phosphate isomerase A
MRSGKKLKRSWTDWDRWKLKNKPESTEKAKRNAALEAIKHVRDGFIIGLGSGSTAAIAIEEIGNRVKREKLHVLGVPTSYQALMLAVKNKLPLTTLDEHPVIDLAIDGADQIDDDLNMIKGMGGALVREKIVASSSRNCVIIADETKKVKMLGENNQSVPVEVVPFAAALVTRRIEEIGGRAVLREGMKKVGPVITDNGNMIIDAFFGIIREPEKLERKLKGIVGVVETGLFVGMADVVYLGTETSARKLERSR